MKTVSLSGSLRENVGKKDAKKHRKVGHVPCVIYGGKEQIHFHTDERSFNKLIFTPEIAFVNIQLDGKEYKAILQDVQYHPVSDRVIHADFLELVEGKEIKMGVPVIIEGVSSGILKGGRLIKKLRRISLKALAENIPENITVDISPLEIGDSIKVKDLNIDNVEFLDSQNSIVVGVRVTRAVEEEEAVVEGEEIEGAEEKTEEAKKEE